jgi:uncharacterized protein (TIGR02246 family)
MRNAAEGVAHSFLLAINHQDVERLAGLMTPDHRFIDSMGNVTRGRAAVRTGWEKYFAMVPNYSIAVDETLSSGPVVVMLGVAQGTLASEGGGLPTPPPENLWKIPAVVRAFVEDGKVAEWRVYADVEPVRVKLGMKR